MKTTDRTLIARWVEAEALKQKSLGFSFVTIADSIAKAGRGEAPSAVPMPAGVVFPADYKITERAVSYAYERAINREPSLAAHELRQLDNHRSEEMLVSLQPGIRKGDPHSINSGIRLLNHLAEINGYKAPQRVELKGDVKVGDNAEERRHQLELLRVMTPEERATLSDILRRAQSRLAASGNGKVQHPAIETTATAIPEDKSRY